MSENKPETKKSSKEIWLVLIFVDIIALCILSYFIYVSFVNNGQKTVQVKRDAKTNEFVLEEIDLTEPAKKETKKETKKESVKETKQEPAKEVKQEPAPEVKTVKEEAKQEPKKEAQPVKTEAAPAKETTTQTAQKETKETKESFVISGTGKWRKVTFRYFEDAKSVSIVSGFTMRKPQALKKVKGVWETTLTIAPGTYKYMFIVDGQEVKDPYNKQEESGRSVIVIK